jgi:hypothetical protein
MEGAKDQNWALEPQEKQICVVSSFVVSKSWNIRVEL